MKMSHSAPVPYTDEHAGSCYPIFALLMTPVWHCTGSVRYKTFTVIPCEEGDLTWAVRRFAIVAGIFMKKMVPTKRANLILEQVVMHPEAIFNVMLTLGVVLVLI